MKHAVLALCLTILLWLGASQPSWAAIQEDIDLLIETNECPVCILDGADLSDRDLSGANLKIATLTDANLSGAKLLRANLMLAYMDGVNLSNADLTGAQMNGAQLSQA
ncbi:MAG TPA: pentapeptide repeat-containing protein, partial [Candidatus Obscuribacterales bacterium]